jgi:hypothetical protein
LPRKNTRIQVWSEFSRRRKLEAQEVLAMRKQWYRVSTVALVAGLMASSPALWAGSTASNERRGKGQGAQDKIEVVGHIALGGGNGPVTRLLTTQHYNRSYLYVERAGAKGVELIDVTKANQPSVIANVPYPAAGAREELVSVAGTSALVTQQLPRAASTPESMQIMDFADVEHPKVVREFTGVTAVAKDDRRGLIFLANSDGLWILRQQLAEDPAMAKAYEDYVNYYR